MQSPEPAAASASDAGRLAAAPTEPALRGVDLRLGFGQRTVVDSVSLSLQAGSVTAFVGPNGSGKSTLLRALARLHPVAAGTVLMRSPSGETNPTHTLSSKEFAREVTLFAQSRVAPQGISVREVVAFGRYPYRRRFAGLGDVDRAAIDRAMTLTGITDMAERAAGELSGGELQRVWLAACLAQHTGIVLLDEPTNHLDLRYQMETLDVIRDLADEHGVAVGVVLHDLDQAARIADRLLLMHNGTILADGEPAAVLTADNISRAYEIRVEVSHDPRNGSLRIDPIARHTARSRVAQLPDPHRS